jgi:hypothetical protein
MTTTTTTPTAMFPTRTSRAALRAAAILGLCAALAGGFVAHASQAPRASDAASAAGQLATSPAPARAAS